MVRLVSIALLLLSTPAVAQTKNELRDARMRVDLATNHFRAARYDQAVEEFLRVTSVLEEPGITWNIARCYEELGDTVNAVHYFEQFVEKYPKDRSSEPARLRIRRLRDLLPGKLVVECGEDPKAKATLDEDMAIPCGEVVGPISPGFHSLSVRSTKQGTWRGEVRVAPGKTKTVRLDWTRLALAQDEETADPSSEEEEEGWSQGDLALAGGVVGAVVFVGVGIAVYATETDRVEVPTTSLGTRTVLQR